MPRLKPRVWLAAKAARTPTPKNPKRLAYLTDNGTRYVYNGHHWKRQSVRRERASRYIARFARWTWHAVLWSSAGVALGVLIIFLAGLFFPAWLAVLMTL